MGTISDGIPTGKKEWWRATLLGVTRFSYKVYDLVTKTPEKGRNLVRRSSDFIKLEKIADEYEQKEIKNDCIAE